MGADEDGDLPGIRARDRRAQPREPVGAAVRLHLDPGMPEPRMLDGVVGDLSILGMKVVTSKYWLSPHEACIVEFVDPVDELPGEGIAGFVRWAMQDDPDRSVFGIEFEEPLPDGDTEG